MLSKSSRIILAICALLLIITVRFSGLWNYLDFKILKEYSSALIAIVNAHYTLSVSIFIAGYALIMAILLPAPYFILTIASGALFGTFLGALYSVIGATIGSTLGMLLVRNVIGEHIQKRYEKELAPFNKYFHEYGSFFLVLVHTIGIFPFFLINILCGLTNVSLFTFIWTTIVGIAGGSLIFAYMGHTINQIESVRDIFSVPVMVLFSSLTVGALVLIIIKYLITKRTN